MSKTTLELSRQEWGRFSPAQILDENRWESDEDVEARWQHAHDVATRAAQILRAEFGATTVWLFGSLTRRIWFTPWSDIDLAVEGIRATRFYAAVAAIISLSPEIMVDLVDISACQSDLRETILREGQQL